MFVSYVTFYMVSNNVSGLGLVDFGLSRQCSFIISTYKHRKRIILVVYVDHIVLTSIAKLKSLLDRVFVGGNLCSGKARNRPPYLNLATSQKALTNVIHQMARTKHHTEIRYFQDKLMRIYCHPII